MGIGDVPLHLQGGLLLVGYLGGFFSALALGYYAAKQSPPATIDMDALAETLIEHEKLEELERSFIKENRQ